MKSGLRVPKVGHLGFTGTRVGMSYPQATGVLKCLLEFDPNWVHHGDCYGADLEFHLLAKLDGTFSIHVHPPRIDTYRAFCEADMEDEPLDYLDRNKVIVNSSEILIAAPSTNYSEVQRSGTWATIRYAREIDIPIYIVRPNGRVQQENGRAKVKTTS